MSELIPNHEPHPLDDGIWIVRSALPDLTTALNRRAAIFGSVLGTAASLLVPPPARAFAQAADTRLVELADAYEAVERLEKEIMAFRPSTLNGFVMKAKWIQKEQSAAPLADQLVADLCAHGYAT